ncbi:MAG TPA: hypothetical protein PKU83_00740 [Chryseolinea sp.]|nr:hypothetical protein [Chryseolinea sp.]
MSAVNTKDMIARNAKKLTKFKYKDRVKVRAVKDTFIVQKNGDKTPVLVSGKTYKPHRLMAEQMVKDKVAEYVK